MSKSEVLKNGERKRQSWEWETDFEQSFWLNIGEEEGLESLVDAREPKPLSHFVQRKNG